VCSINIKDAASPKLESTRVLDFSIDIPPFQGFIKFVQIFDKLRRSDISIAFNE